MAESEGVKDFVKRRSTIKARLTCFSKYITTLTEKEFTANQVIELEQRINHAKSLINEFNDIQLKIDMAVDDENLEKQMEERIAFESSFFSVMSQAENVLLIHRKPSDLHTDKNPMSEHSFSHNTNTQGVKLPTIKIPTFAGKYDNWLEFRDTYLSLIHENDAISDIQKYHYLRASLVNSAAQVIRSIEFSASNYPVAWDTVFNRYNNTRLLINNHIQAILNFESITKESAGKLRDLSDNISKHLKSLDTLKEPVDKWDTLIIFLMVGKLDPTTSREWEEYKIDKDYPSLQQFQTFLKGKADLLETLENNNQSKNVGTKLKQQNSHKTFLISNTNCHFCKENHPFYNCKIFLELSVEDRLSKVKALKLCINCLKPGHFSKTCKYGTCKKCNSKHNTLLHITKVNEIDTTAHANKAGNSSSVTVHTYKTNCEVFLSTALVNILDINGKPKVARALLDSAAQSSFITTELSKQLRLNSEEINIAVAALSDVSLNIEGRVKTKIEAIDNAFESEITCLVVPMISNRLPSCNVNISHFKIPNKIKLADPSFNIPGNIDLLIGADLFWKIIMPTKQFSKINQPTLQKTVFGWIIGGPFNDDSQKKEIHCKFVKVPEIQTQLQQFWEIEECMPNNTKPLSPDEIHCENHFANNTRRNNDGRFIVKIPFKHDPSHLGDSRQIAVKQFMNLERKLLSNPKLKDSYEQFLDEYLKLGHMTNTKDDSQSSVNSYFMPHHGVLKESSSSTKLRVVFNASMATTSGYSLNDLQMTGPTIQEDLLSVILRFRKHRYVISADIEKMYRQVLIDNDDRQFQKIIWRRKPRRSVTNFRAKHCNLRHNIRFVSCY